MTDTKTVVDQEQNAGSAENTQEQAATPQIDYDRIQNIIDKGTKQKESAILKSYFEQQGLAEADIKSAISEYKKKKEAEANQTQEEMKRLSQTTQQLQEALKAEKLNANAFQVALDMGIDRKAIPYALKMADFGKAFDDKGELNADEIQAALDAVKKDVPALFAKDNKSTGFKVGADGAGGEAEDEKMKNLRSIMGLGN